MNNTFDITVKNSKWRGFGSILWEIIGVGFNHASLDLTVTIKESLYTNTPDENMWDVYFEPINNNNKIDYGMQQGGYSYDLNIFKNIEAKINWNKFYCDRIVLKAEIKTEFDKFYNQYFMNKKVVGVHYRSTDIYNEFARLKQISDRFGKATVEMYFNELDKLKCDYIYLATDSSLIFDQFKTKYPNLISYATIRSSTPSGIHYANNQKTDHGREALIETLLMSKCDYLLHGQNNLPACAHIMNPNIKYKNLDYREDE